MPSFRSPSLTSFPSLVQAPFIIVDIGGYTFGNVSKTKGPRTLNVKFPDVVQSMNVIKINGQINTYTINMAYAITPGRDPNMMDKVLGHIAETREISIQYGDWTFPNSIFKEEKAIVSSVKTNVNFAASQIQYTLTCIGTPQLLKSTSYSFPPRFAKPSDVIKELVQNKKYGLQDVFKGMITNDSIAELIQGGDKEVQIQAQSNTDVVSYLSYLVNCMIPVSGTGFYRLQMFDDNSNKFNGPYFNVQKVSPTATSYSSNQMQTQNIGNMYTIDIGYPGENFVTGFNLRDDENWAVLYKNTESIQQEQHQYKLDAFGNVKTNTAPSITRSKSLLTTTPTDETWWTRVTEFPISATVDIKGLIRPTILMSYIYLNVVFYGMPHISTGTYVITKQTDSIGPDGYTTKLELLRTQEFN